MNVFISYSVNDTSLVMMIVSHLRLQGHSVRWWHESKEPGKDMWPQIFGWIDAADLVLAVVTDNTVARGLAVGNEIGRAKTKGKMIIPLVAQNVVASDLGCLVRSCRSGSTPETSGLQSWNSSATHRLRLFPGWASRRRTRARRCSQSSLSFF